MAHVKTDLLVDLGDGENCDKVPDLPLNLKSFGNVSKSITSSLSTPGSSFYTSGSDGIQTSAKTKSRLSSIFLQRPTILNCDDDPFDLKPKGTLANINRDEDDSFNSPISCKSVRTGVLISLGEDSKDETVDGVVTDWESLKFEANAIVGDIHLSTKKNRRAKIDSKELKRLDFSLLSPIYGGELGRSRLHFSDSEENSDSFLTSKDDISYNCPSTNYRNARNDRSWDKENLSHNSLNISPVKLLDFSTCDLSDLDVDQSDSAYFDSNQAKGISKSLSLVSLGTNDNNNRASNIENGGKENFQAHQLPDVVINTKVNTGDVISYKTHDTLSVSSNLNNNKRKSLYAKSGSIHNIATDSKFQKNIQKNSEARLITANNKQATPIRSGLATPARRLSMQTNANGKGLRNPTFQAKKPTVVAKMTKQCSAGLTSDDNASASFKHPSTIIRPTSSKLQANTKVTSTLRPSNKSKLAFSTIPMTSTVSKPSNVLDKGKIGLTKNLVPKESVTKPSSQVKIPKQNDFKQRNTMKTTDAKGVKGISIKTKSEMAPNLKSSRLNASKYGAYDKTQHTYSTSTANKCDKTESRTHSAANYEKYESKSINFGQSKMNSGGTYNLTDFLNKFNATGN